MQELRITMKVTIPVDDADAFLMAQALLDARSRIQDAGNMLAGNAGLVEVVSKLVTPRRAIEAAQDDSTVPAEVILLAQEQTAPVSEAVDETTETVTDIRTAPWRRAIKAN